MPRTRLKFSYFIGPKLRVCKRAKKSGFFELIYSAQLKQQNNSDSQIAVYYHPCNQNTNNHFGPLKQKEIRKLTFVIVSGAFSCKQADPFVFVLSPLSEFSFIFRCKVCSAAGGHIKKLEILPRLHFERALGFPVSVSLCIHCGRVYSHL